MKILSIIKGIIGWLLKDVAQIVGVVEAIAKLLVGIISLTPTKKDDPFIPAIDKAASAIKKVLYTISDKLMGKIV